MLVKRFDGHYLVCLNVLRLVNRTKPTFSDHLEKMVILDKLTCQVVHIHWVVLM
jgi:hypothetical protein